jgi:hypothetical protein
MARLDSSLLQAALIGYRHQLSEIDAAMADIQKRLGPSSPSTDLTPFPRKKRRLSAAGRKRIIAATKKWWAEYKKAKGAVK